MTALRTAVKAAGGGRVLRPGMPAGIDELRALIAQLFGNGEQGAMYIPQPQLHGQQVLYQDAAGTVPVTQAGQDVLYQGATNEGAEATSATADQTYEMDGNVHYVDHTAGSLSATLPDLGANATRVVVIWEGVEYLEGQTISGAVTLPPVQYEAVIYIDRALTADEKEQIESTLANTWLLADGAWDDSGQWRDIAIWEDAA